MLKQTFLPESLYKLDSEMTRQKISFLYESSAPVIGKVTRLNSAKELLEVNLGGGINGTMLYSDATIYPVYKEDGQLSPNIYDLVGKTIQAKIVAFDENDVLLSRKENMLLALDYFKFETYIPEAVVTGLSRLSAFIDIGAGIMGRCFGKNCSPIKYKDIRDVNIERGQIISVSIIEFIETKNNFELSRVSNLDQDNYVINKHDVVTCKVSDPVGDAKGIGYFVSLCGDQYAGIVNSPEEQLEYGDEIVAIVKKVSEKGAKLTFVKKI